MSSSQKIREMGVVVDIKDMVAIETGVKESWRFWELWQWGGGGAGG